MYICTHNVQMYISCNIYTDLFIDMCIYFPIRRPMVCAQATV